MSNNSYPYTSNKSCYRLYAGHGNWINLGAKTTQDLLQIFGKGEPCRYQLAPGLSIDIIPHDVDCNSKNIDMVGLMRADLVYEPHLMEGHVQQLMSHYVRNLLEKQNIVDVFPPTRPSENLPIITSIPTHRHLSLVPMVMGAARRGPKAYQPAYARTTPSTSSASSTAFTQEGNHTPISSSSFSSDSSPTRKRKAKSVITRRKQPKQTKSAPTVELSSQRMIAASDYCPSAMNLRLFANFPQLDNTMDQDYHYNHPNNTHSSLLNNHSLPPPPPPPPPSSSQVWAQPYSSRSTHNNNFDFDFNVEFDQSTMHRQSPTDILHEYDRHFSSSSSFNDQQQPQQPTQQPQHHNELYSMPHALLSENNNQQTSSEPHLESYVPSSPIPNQNQ
ncbi:uncharacterized protein B0P05DRAFT_571499 [Gilbertella persicaria]|uniref:uncharacterized protein n=1 Tax=Gilbertella persicaria TaxID=101096 RepID=UPI00221FB854|nr:uncharacterized protein B0P05DRAFT_571499 [Gilbertella persicaria]KAI8079576.1 hypothetical protein B0P05DRAFT_571499 [Gilbertella persicaria]